MSAIMEERGMIPDDGGFVIEKYAKYIFERGGMKPDASLPPPLQKIDMDVLDEAARRVQGEILKAGGAGSKAMPRPSNSWLSKGVREAIHNIRDRLEETRKSRCLRVPRPLRSVLRKGN
jgi:hypothetical protein